MLALVNDIAVRDSCSANDITVQTTSLVRFVFTAAIAALQSIAFSTVGTLNDSGEMCDMRDASRGFLEDQ